MAHFYGMRLLAPLAVSGSVLNRNQDMPLQLVRAKRTVVESLRAMDHVALDVL
jgi:hypothetical protein